MQVYHPALGATLNYEFTPVPDGGDAQIEATIGQMRRYALADSHTPAILSDSRQALAESPHLPPESAVFYYVKRRVRFVKDETTAQPIQSQHPASLPPIVEVLIRPVDMSTLTGPRVGDCDDFAMWTAAMLVALGIRCAFVTVAADPGTPGEFSHVYVAAYPGEGRGRVALDTSHGNYPGWETKDGTRIQEWPVQAGAAESIFKLGLVAAVAAIGAKLCK